MIEELAVAAQHRMPYIHVPVNNSYLGLIRRSQMNFDMDFNVKLDFKNVHSPEVSGYGVDHVKVAEGLGCKAVRILGACPRIAIVARAFLMEACFSIN